jgi:hypothetical protein
MRSELNISLDYMLFHHGNFVAIKYSQDRNEMVVIVKSERATLGGFGTLTDSTIGLMLMVIIILTMTMVV